MSNKPRIFGRLAGLETEYAISLRNCTQEVPPTRLEVYERVLVALSQKLPIVRAWHLKDGAFLATGGAVWFEADRLSDDAGLIEGATPECRGPGELIAYQRAQDRLLEEAVARSSFDCEIRLLKNDRDAFNNIYGAQENYEAEFASGISLILWRIGLVLLFPLMLLTWLGTLVLYIAGELYDVLASGLIAPLGDLVATRGTVGRALLGDDRVDERPFGAGWPSWLESVFLTAQRAVGAPLGCALFLLLRLVGFRRIRRKLLSFLVTRPIIAGAGMLDGDGRFLLSDKSPAMNCIMGYGNFLHGRPMILLGDFYKRLAHDAIFSPHDFLDLFRPRQRLQIGVGDSNMCETAEWLRVGSTMLVLDCIEAGEMPDPPALAHPVQSLRAVCVDTELGRAVQTRQGPCTAIQLQRFYCEACRKFLRKQSEVPGEAWDLLRCWEQTLDALEDDPRSLVGTLDWVTKRFMLEHTAQNSSWESLKKIDLKYHELSSEGYFRVLSEQGDFRTIVRENDLDRAMRMPPSGTPAAMRGRLLREFAGGDEPLAINWRMVRIGRGIGAKVYRLSEYQDDALRDGDKPATEHNASTWLDNDTE